MYKIINSNKMSTFMKKKDDETWTEWNNRWFNDQDKLDCIEEYIYEYTVWGGKGREITDLLLVMGVEGLIPLLESEELLDAKIEEAYEAIREFEEYKMTEEDDMFEEDCLSAQVERRLAKEALRMANEKVEYLEARREQMRIDMENHQVAWAERCSEIVPCVFCSKDTAKVKRDCGFDICNDCFEVNKTSDGGCLLPLSHRVCWPRGESCDEPELDDEEDEKCEQCGKTEEDCITEGMMFDTGCLSIYAGDNRLLCPDCIPSFDNDNDDDFTINQPVITLTVAEMIAALSKLPPDAKLVMTESGFYSKSDFAEVMLPKLYTVQNDSRWPSELPTDTQVYIIGHSHQSYL